MHSLSRTKLCIAHTGTVPIRILQSYLLNENRAIKLYRERFASIRRDIKIPGFGCHTNASEKLVGRRDGTVYKVPPLSAGICRATIVGILYDVVPGRLQRACVHDTKKVTNVPCMMLRLQTLTFSSDNLSMNIPCTSKDMHKILVHNSRISQDFTFFLQEACHMHSSKNNVALCIQEAEWRGKLIMRVTGDVGLHNSYVAKYAKKVHDPTLHVLHAAHSIHILRSS